MHVFAQPQKGLQSTLIVQMILNILREGSEDNERN